MPYLKKEQKCSNPSCCKQFGFGVWWIKFSRTLDFCQPCYQDRIMFNVKNKQKILNYFRNHKGLKTEKEIFVASNLILTNVLAKMIK